MTIVCITGMHRSGTSMIARMLNMCGVYLGKEEHLLDKAGDNPEGYWENKLFVELNDNILWHLNGGWDTPPEIASNEYGSLIPPKYHLQAVNLIDQMASHPNWGWKDPRNSLTYPFWQEILPDMKVVLCVRNPSDVAFSMAKRGFSSFPFSGNLWKTYYERILTFVPDQNLVVTHYDSFFTETKLELTKLLSFLDISTNEQTITNAIKALKIELRHNKSSPKELLNFPNSSEIIDLYDHLCTRAGVFFQKPETNNTKLHDNEVSASASASAENSTHLAPDKINNTSTDIAKRQAETIKSLSVQLYKKDNELSDKDQNIQSLSDQILDHKNQISNLTTELQEIKTGITWKLYQFIVRLRLILIPPGSYRERLVHLLLRTNQVLRIDGLSLTTRRVFNKLKTFAQRGKRITLRSLSTSHLTSEDMSQDNNSFVSLSDTNVAPENILAKLIAFYLPQFHPIPENDLWWGKGFTEWTNVAKATPNFKGHYQPHLPGELGYYDLRLPEVMEQQITLAKKYGIYGFCFYYYWFAGKRLLERPIDQFLTNTHLDLPFCLCWANENWTRRWDGAENDVLIAQEYTEEQYLHFIQDISKHFSDSRYIRVDGKPMLLVYRVNLLPDPQKAVEVWRTECKKMGLGDIYLVAVQSFGITDPRPFGFDAAVEFPPSHLGMAEINQGSFEITNPNFKGRLFDYNIAANSMLNKEHGNYPYFKTVMPSWDNTARKQNNSHIFINSSPAAYKTWLEKAVAHSQKALPKNKRFIFVNAWNEWAEGTHLEPDRIYGYAHLQATAEAVTKKNSTSNWTILFVSHDANKGGAQDVLINTVTWFTRHTNINVKVLCLQGGEWLFRFDEIADTLVLNASELSIKDGSIVERIELFCDGIPDLIYGNTVAAGSAYAWLHKLNAPILTHFHELESSIRKYGDPWIDDVKKFSKKFIACSNTVEANLIDNHAVSPEKISTVYASIQSRQLNILNSKEKKSLRKKLGLSQDRVLIFGCGIGMPFRKGADLFIQLAEILIKKGYKDSHFYWIGEFDAAYHDKEYGLWEDHYSKTKNRELKKHITFLGIKDNPREYLSCGDVFVLPSREDPFPLVALEAADCGLPIICFDKVGGMPDFVGEDAGFVVPKDDLEAMAQKTIHLIKEKEHRDELGRKSREKLLNGFTTEHTIPHILSVCRRVAKKEPAVSVIVPNYNHANYLEERLDSIFDQTFKDFELILLDDASPDNSVDILKKYTHHADVQLVTNEINSGSPFKQWLKGIDMAKSGILWIAESDDTCNPDFIKTLLSTFNDPKVKLAYSNSHIINEDGKIIGDYIETEYLSSLSRTKWSDDYLVTAEQEINDGLGVKNTILNISAVLIRRFEMEEGFKDTLGKMRIAGDWYFITHAIKDGYVAYNSNKLNFHRRHSKSVIAQATNQKKLQDFFKEFIMVQEFIFRKYSLSPEFSGKWETYLRKQWDDFTNGGNFDEFSKQFPFEQMKQAIEKNIKVKHA